MTPVVDIEGSWLRCTPHLSHGEPGQALAHETLRLASQHREMDSFAVTSVMGAAYDVMRGQEKGVEPPPIFWVAWSFIEEILDVAVSNYSLRPRGLS